jgi:hypothetical protein
MRLNEIEGLEYPINSLVAISSRFTAANNKSLLREISTTCDNGIITPSAADHRTTAATNKDY